MINFKNGISSYGIPVAGDLPFITGTWYFVLPDQQTDSSINRYPGKSSNDGKSLEKPLSDFKDAYDKCVTGRGDGICVLSHGTTTAHTSTYLTASLDWSKNAITVVGRQASHMFGRARIVNSSAALSLAYIIDVQGDNNAFYNINVSNFGSNVAALGGLKVNGGNRNYFKRCHIVGGGHATPAVEAGANALALIGADENLFEDCIIGTDTVDQTGSAVSGLINFDDGCARNRFYHCEFITYYSDANAIAGAIKHVGAGDSITRTQIFENCIFTNYKEGLPTTNDPVSLVVGTAPNNGVIWLINCSVLGYVAFDTTAGNDRVFVSAPAASATGGLAIVTA